MPALPTNFRLIDIDAYEDGNLTAEELVDPHPLAGDPGAASSQAKSKAGEVRSMLMKNDTAGALAVALADAPYGASLHEARATSLATVLSILNSTRSTDIPKVVAALDPASQDTLMKYLYTGMQSVEEGGNCSVLLNWHEKLTEVAGVGCIVRTMSDHRVV